MSILLANKTEKLDGQEITLDSPLLVKSGSTLNGNGTTIKFTGAHKNGLVHILNGCRFATIRDTIFDFSNYSFGLKNLGTCENIKLERCHFIGTTTNNNLVEFTGTTMAAISGLEILSCSLIGSLNAIELSNKVSNAVVDNCKMELMRRYALILRGSPDVMPGPQHITFSNNTSFNPSAGKLAAARQGIVCYAHKDNRRITMEHINIIANKVYGSKQYWNPTDPNSAGTADQYAIHYCRYLNFQRNESYFGGENGITIAACEDGIVSNNISQYHDGHAMQVSVGRIDDSDWRCTRMLVTNNHVGLSGIRLDPHARDTMAGLYCQGLLKSRVADNYIYDTNPRKQAYGINISACEEIDLGHNSIFCDDPTFKPVVMFKSTRAKPYEIYPPGA